MTNKVAKPMLLGASEKLRAKALSKKAAPDFYGTLRRKAETLAEVARINKSAELKPFEVQWQWSAPGHTITKVEFTAQVVYDEHGRNDKTQTFKSSGKSLTQKISIGSDFIGGLITCTCVVHFKGPQGNAGTTPPGQARGRINGENPDKSAVRAHLGSVQLQVIAYKESRFRQFDKTGYPLFGPPNGFGMMQIDNPKPTAHQIWSWKSNADAGKKLWKTKNKEVKQHFSNLYKKHPKLRKLTADELKLAENQYYNGGWYWGLNATKTDWVKDGVTDYGDDAVRLEKLIASGGTPPDWN